MLLSQIKIKYSLLQPGLQSKYRSNSTTFPQIKEILYHFLWNVIDHILVILWVKSKNPKDLGTMKDNGCKNTMLILRLYINNWKTGCY